MRPHNSGNIHGENLHLWAVERTKLFLRTWQKKPLVSLVLLCRKKIVVAYFSEKRSSIIKCHITSFKRVLILYTINRIGVVFKRRTIKHKHTCICWRQLLCIIRLNNWAMSGLQSGSSNTSCGYSIKMLSKYWLVRHKHLVIGRPCNPKRNPTGNRMIFSVASIGLSHSNKLNSGNVCSQVL